MSRVIQKTDDNEISEDFEQLMGNKNNDSPKVENSSRDKNIMHQQMMEQQQQQQQQEMMEYQKMLQQQAQQQAQPSKEKEDKSQTLSANKEIKESFININDLTKSLTSMFILLTLFYIFSSPQISDLLKNIPYLSNPLFGDHLNILIRGLFLVVIYYLLNKFVV
jgi:cation transport ATPase